ncbi:MAG: hypothetical protein KDE19_13875 [Caldilineaceae bacterium]|nr:hypothetical protein [Caldilineaceae bacterium]
MKIDSPQHICNLFSFFHDGVVAYVVHEGSDLLLEIEIQYLAERIESSYKKFLVRLSQIQDILFKTWPNDPKSDPKVLRSIEIIFKPELEILASNSQEGQIQVTCNQSSPEFDYCGGELYFQAAYAEVADEAGRYYSIDELGSLCKSYWDEWSTRNVI